MKLKLSCAHVSVGKCFKDEKMNMKEYISFCADQGIEGADLTNYPSLWADKPAEFKQVRKWAKDAAIELPCYGVGNNFATNDPAKFKAAVENVISGLKDASELCIPCMRIFGGYHSGVPSGAEPGIQFTNGFEKVLAGIEQVLPHAEKYGVVLALENHGRLPSHSWELEKIVKYFDHKYLRVLFDMANIYSNNMNEYEIDGVAAVRRLFPYIVHLHVKDLRPAIVYKDTRKIEAAICGAGIVPIRQIMNELHDLGYQGYLGLEYEAAFIRPEREGIAECFTYLKDVRNFIDLLSGKSKLG